MTWSTATNWTRRATVTSSARSVANGSQMSQIRFIFDFFETKRNKIIFYNKFAFKDLEANNVAIL